MIYNPFMPSVSFLDHAVFGGGGGGGPAPVNPVLPPVSGGPVPITSTFPELEGKEFNSVKEREDAEAKVLEERKQIADADAADKAATEYATTTSSDLTASRQKIQDKINQATLELSQLQAQDEVDAEGNPKNPKIAEKVKAKQEAIEKLKTEMITVSSAQGAEMASYQRDLTAKALKDPTSLATDTKVDKITETTNQIIGAGTGDAGAAGTTTASTAGTTATAAAPTTLTPASVLASTSTGEVQDALKNVTAATGTTSTEVTAAEGDPTKISGLGTEGLTQVDPTKVVPPPARVLKPGEAIEGSSVDMAAVKEATDIQAANADPSKKATVQGQLSELMTDFDGGATPAWAAGAMRAANSAMIARGIGASSMAGQAIVQAAMESALPIASQDAATFAKFEAQNLSNRQQTALFAAEQRASFLKMDFDQDFQARVATAAKISDIANMNFTADQQIALENARIASTTNIANMSAKNAKVMADAAAMATMDLANLSNEQQAQVENAKNFLSMDLANLNNEQQTEVFKAKAIQDAILSDTAAENASKQFNASSKNQTNQFMATMKTQVNQFNTTQTNAMAQFNVSETNAIKQFNTEQINARDQFNAGNSLLVAQANTQWRQKLATANMAAQNDANMQDAKTANAFTASTLDQIWQRERDLMSFAWKSSESHQDRLNNILVAQLGADAATKAAEAQAKASKSASWGRAVMSMFGGW